MDDQDLIFEMIQQQGREQAELRRKQIEERRVKNAQPTPEDIAELYESMMSWLPHDVDKYRRNELKCSEHYSKWVKVESGRVVGELSIEDHDGAVTVYCDYLRPPAIRDVVSVSFNEATESIVVSSETDVLDEPGYVPRKRVHEWRAHLAMWEGVISLLRERLPSEVLGPAASNLLKARERTEPVQAHSSLSRRQELEITAFFEQQRRPVSLIVIEEGQRPEDILEVLLRTRLGAEPTTEDLHQQGRAFNLLPYLANPDSFVLDFRSAAKQCRVIIVYFSTNSVDKTLVDLVAYLVHESFDTGPEVAVLVNKTSAWQPQALHDLFDPRQVLELRSTDEEREEMMRNVLMDQMKRMGF